MARSTVNQCNVIEREEIGTWSTEVTWIYLHLNINKNYGWQWYRYPSHALKLILYRLGRAICLICTVYIFRDLSWLNSCLKRCTVRNGELIVLFNFQKAVVQKILFLQLNYFFYCENLFKPAGTGYLNLRRVDALEISLYPHCNRHNMRIMLSEKIAIIPRETIYVFMYIFTYLYIYLCIYLFMYIFIYLFINIYI